VSARVTVFVACLGFWLLLSGHGVASAALVTVLTRRSEALSATLRVSGRFTVAYVPWLLKEIVVANIQVMRIVIHPRLPIDPVVVRLRSGLASDLAVTALGNSITLTPGTVTVDVDGDELVVHALTRESARSVLAGPMVARVARAVGEPGA
jgi:multicomponent Na+:H+ antiporter subunit E